MALVRPPKAPHGVGTQSHLDPGAGGSSRVGRALAAYSSPSTPPEDLSSDCFLDVNIFSLGKRFACSMTKDLSPNGVGAKSLQALSVLQVTDGEAVTGIITQTFSGTRRSSQRNSGI